MLCITHVNLLSSTSRKLQRAFVVLFQTRQTTHETQPNIRMAFSDFYKRSDFHGTSPWIKVSFYQLCWYPGTINNALGQPRPTFCHRLQESFSPPLLPSSGCVRKSRSGPWSTPLPTGLNSLRGPVQTHMKQTKMHRSL